jgi:5-methyltetrahydrofolate--homocysteine methyltransferase
VRPILERIRAGDVLLADGALGSLLLEHGLRSGDAPEAVCLTQPDRLRGIVKLYQDAGAEVFQANTFGASPLKLAGYGLADKTEEINRAAVEIVRSVAGNAGYVLASVGPSGKLLKPYGDAEPQLVYDSFVRQVSALAQVHPDIIAIETMTDIREALLALKAIKAGAPGIPVLGSMTFEKGRNGFYTIMGNSIIQCASELTEGGADIIGSNCGNGIDDMIAIAREFRAITQLPLAIRPNAGFPLFDGDRVTYPETPEFMAERLPQLLDSGVSIIGGCCGTTPDHIRAFRVVLKAASRRDPDGSVGGRYPDGDGTNLCDRG